MICRPARTDDVAALSALDALVFGEQPYPPVLFRQALDLWPELLLVAGNERPVGYALGAPATTPGETWLLSLAVAPAARGQGVGRALTVAFLAAASGARTVRLTVAPDNPAVRLYASLGFEVVAERPPDDAFGGPRLLMAR